VTHAFISIVGHITIRELRLTLDSTSMANGYANRFLYACVRRSKLLALGGKWGELDTLAARLRERVIGARAIGEMTMTTTARDLWTAVYPELAAEREGPLAEITARAEGQVVRLALIYALLDGNDRIDRHHIEAALAVWRFCEASARYIFGDVTGDATADAILKALRHAGEHGKTRTEIVDLFNRNKRSSEIAQALESLMEAGKARFTKRAQPAGRLGRPIETWFAT
jgi:DNA replicative helicase MCM subunit Mcm2 (Cdc46/Mcm family)